MNNYTLYVDVGNVKKIKLFSSSLKEIDKITSLFDKEEFKEIFLSDINKPYRFYIESNNGAIYNILYSSKREILKEENKSYFFSILKYYIPKEEIKHYLDYSTKVPFYPNNDNIPSNKLYDSLKEDNDSYRAYLHSCLQNYYFYRDILNEIDYKNNGYYKSIKLEKNTINEETKKMKIEQLNKLSNNLKEQYEARKNQYTEVNELDNSIMNIITKDLSLDEKINEISLLLGDETEKISYYLEKYEDELYGKINK